MFCKKCGEVIPSGADFCMSCGTKVEQGVDATKKAEPKPDIKDKPSAFHAETKPNFTKTTENQSKLNHESKTKKSQKIIKIGKFQIKKKIIIIVILAIFGVLLFGGIGYYAFSEFTPQGQYAKGYRIFKELCTYQSTESDQKPLACDSKCLELLDQGRECFDKAKDYSDAKVYYYCFKAMGNLFRTNNNWDSSTWEIYVKQSVSDIVDCENNKYVPSKDIFTPSTEAQKLFIFSKGYVYGELGYAYRDSKSFNTGYDYFATLLQIEDFKFCGKSTSDLKSKMELGSFYLST